MSLWDNGMEVKMNEEPKAGTVPVYRNGNIVYEIPSRQCLVCERMEIPGATIVNEGEAWLCRGCKSRIKKLIYGEEKE